MRIIRHRTPLRFRQRSYYAVPLIVFINTIIYLFWTTAIYTRSIKWVSFLNKYFLISADRLHQGNYWPLLASVFSHNWFLHFLINMLVLLSFGGIVERALGSLRFILFYLLAGIVSSVSHALTSEYFLGNPHIPALGASGAIAGVVLLFSLMFPTNLILIFGLIPVPAIVGALAFVGIDIWGLVAQTQGGGLPIGHGAHLGGAFAGVLYYFFYYKKRRWKGRYFPDPF
ncbi:MAG: rhomboid family intramembrane serine protease [Bdellovibrio sp.]|nr:MAG: rhomboid family intramembrane serine protease [Bdellovibrio sp.]